MIIHAVIIYWEGNMSRNGPRSSPYRNYSKRGSEFGSFEFSKKGGQASPTWHGMIGIRGSNAMSQR